jgi:hypothetical protein
MSQQAYASRLDKKPCELAIMIVTTQNVSCGLHSRTTTKNIVARSSRILYDNQNCCCGPLAVVVFREGDMVGLAMNRVTLTRLLLPLAFWITF